jgi:hypothetical protein
VCVCVKGREGEIERDCRLDSSGSEYGLVAGSYEYDHEPSGPMKVSTVLTR